MKSIVFIIESLHLGGAEKSLITLLNNLDYSKYSVDLITFQKGGFFLNEVPKEVNHIIISMPQTNLVERIRFALKKKWNKGKYHHAQLLWQIISSKFCLIEKSYDFAVAYNQGFATYFTSEYISAKKKYAWINTDYKKAGYNIDFDFPIYKNFDKVVTVSSDAFESFNDELIKIDKKLEVDIVKDISDADDIKKRSNEILKYHFQDNTLKIVSVGRLVKPKGFHLAVEACRKLLDKGYNVEWIIVGDGSERLNLENLIKQNKLETHFKLIGSDNNPYPYMKACDVYVQTSLFEGLGLTVIEASYLLKPIVCTNFPTAFGILKHEETGLITEMNSDSISQSIEKMLVDKDLKNKLVSNLALTENKDKEKTLNQIEELFNNETTLHHKRD